MEVPRRYILPRDEGSQLRTPQASYIAISSRRMCSSAKMAVSASAISGLHTFPLRLRKRDLPSSELPAPSLRSTHVWNPCETPPHARVRPRPRNPTWRNCLDRVTLGYCLAHAITWRQSFTKVCTRTHAATSSASVSRCTQRCTRNCQLPMMQTTSSARIQTLAGRAEGVSGNGGSARADRGSSDAMRDECARRSSAAYPSIPPHGSGNSRTCSRRSRLHDR